jgi:hypothetical protein
MALVRWDFAIIAKDRDIIPRVTRPLANLYYQQNMSQV